MKKLSFLLGFIVGVLFTAIVVVYGFNEEEEPERQYVEIKTEQGRISVYVGMSKDTVLSFMGKPDRASMGTIGSSVLEDWKYDGDLISGVPSTSFKIVDGKVKNISQYN